jgi:hypothetical protein
MAPCYTAHPHHPPAVVIVSVRSGDVRYRLTKSKQNACYRTSTESLRNPLTQLGCPTQSIAIRKVATTPDQRLDRHSHRVRQPQQQTDRAGPLATQDHAEMRLRDADFCCELGLGVAGLPEVVFRTGIDADPLHAMRVLRDVNNVNRFSQLSLRFGKSK